MINALWVYDRPPIGVVRYTHGRGSVECEEIRRVRPQPKGRRSNVLKFRKPRKARKE